MQLQIDFRIKISADNDDEQMLQGQAIIFFSQSTYIILYTLSTKLTFKA